MKSAVPHFDAQQLLESLGLAGRPDVTLARLRKLPGVRQQGVLDHGAAVAAHLRGLGLEAQLLAGLLRYCPILFSWAPDQRAAVLFKQLMDSGLTAAEAAPCFRYDPTAAETGSFAAGIAELAALLGRGRSSRKGPQAAVAPEAWTVAGLLRRVPSAVKLVCGSAGWLQGRSVGLQQLGYEPADVAWVAWHRPELLARDAAKLMQQAKAVLCQEMGLQPEQALQALKRGPRWLTCSSSTLLERVQAMRKVRCQQYQCTKRPSAAALGGPAQSQHRSIRHMPVCSRACPFSGIRG